MLNALPNCWLDPAQVALAAFKVIGNTIFYLINCTIRLGNWKQPALPVGHHALLGLGIGRRDVLFRVDSVANDTF